MNMMMYTRYVDDSNQIIETSEDDEEKVAQTLKGIANSVLDGIVMEEDLPGRYEDRRLPILDMKVWLKEGIVYYIHYEKPMATKLIIPERSAHSRASKRSVHVSEILRRCLNTSRRLKWEEHTVPSLNEYMVRMKMAGYNETYRKDVLFHAIQMYERKVAESESGGVPLNRPNSYRKVERRKEKTLRKKNWNKKGGHTAPIMVPATPNSELAKILREVAEKEAVKGVKFKIVEKGGRTIERSLVRTNPIGKDECGKEDCPVCTQAGGGKLCHKSNVNYQMKCESCPNSMYFGESHRNLYSRGKEHVTKLQKRDEASFMHRHQVEKHGGGPAKFKMQVVKSCRDPLTRQVTEAVMIKNHRGELLNTKSEFHQPPLVRIRSEIVRGLDE